jgi:hypothetical protein
MKGRAMQVTSDVSSSVGSTRDLPPLVDSVAYVRIGASKTHVAYIIPPRRLGRSS